MATQRKTPARSTDKAKPTRGPAKTAAAKDAEKTLVIDKPDAVGAVTEVEVPLPEHPTTVPDTAPDAVHPDSETDTLEERGDEARKQATLSDDGLIPLGADPKAVAKARKEAAAEVGDNAATAGDALDRANDDLTDVSKADQKKLAEAEKHVNPTLEPVEDAKDYAIVASVSDKGHAFGTSNYFSVGASERYGLPIIALATRNHVGPAPLVVPLDTIDELVALLTAVSKEAKKNR